MPRTPVTLRENTDLWRLEAVTEDGTVAGFVSYQRTDDGDFVAVHTEVDPAFEGQGVGGQIARAVVELVRKSGHKLRPDCEFIAGWMREHPESHDVLREGITF